METTLYVLGARGTATASGKEFLEYGGYTTCFAILRGDYAVFIDCGSGISQAKRILPGIKEADLLISHLHYDHISGLLMGGAFPAKPHVYTTFSKWGEATILESFAQPPFWPVGLPVQEYHNVETEKPFSLKEGIEATFYPSNHPNYSNIIKITVDGKSIIFMIDYEHGKEMDLSIFKDCDILVYDGMFTNEEYEAHRGWGHSTMEKGVEFAKACGAKQLVISHHAPQREDSQLKKLEETLQKEMSQLVFAKNGMEFKL